MPGKGKSQRHKGGKSTKSKHQMVAVGVQIEAVTRSKAADDNADFQCHEKHG